MISDLPDPRVPAKVRPAETSDRKALEHTLGHAFADDPVWMWLLGGRRIDPAKSGKVLAAFVMPHVKDGVSTITANHHSAAVWAPPKRFLVSPRQMMPYAYGAVRGLGFRGLTRLGPLSELDKEHPSEPHYYLALLGTHPHHQGRGLGGAAMEPTKALADEQGVGCYLESSKEENVPLYERHGFEVTGVFDIDKGNGPRLWKMWRDPQPPLSPTRFP